MLGEKRRNEVKLEGEREAGANLEITKAALKPYQYIWVLSLGQWKVLHS